MKERLRREGRKAEEACGEEHDGDAERQRNP
jgi:hypothetical protein